jgi:hypothetical protein
VSSFGDLEFWAIGFAVLWLKLLFWMTLLLLLRTTDGTYWSAHLCNSLKFESFSCMAATVQLIQ